MYERAGELGRIDCVWWWARADT